MIEYVLVFVSSYLPLQENDLHPLENDLLDQTQS